MLILISLYLLSLSYASSNFFHPLYEKSLDYEYIEYAIIKYKLSDEVFVLSQPYKEKKLNHIWHKDFLNNFVKDSLNQKKEIYFE